MTPAELALAVTLAQQGVQYWIDYQQRAVAGTLTRADLDAGMAKMGTDINKLEADIAAQNAKPPSGPAVAS